MSQSQTSSGNTNNDSSYHGSEPHDAEEEVESGQKGARYQNRHGLDSGGPPRELEKFAKGTFNPLKPLLIYATRLPKKNPKAIGGSRDWVCNICGHHFVGSYTRVKQHILAITDNLLLTADQKKVKLVDFGLAREETLTEMMTAETGTYRWMAPELYSTVTLRHGEKKHYNHKVDAYSFAIVLWELLTNRMPFEGMSNLQAAYAAAFKNVRPSSENLPEEMASILESCWAQDPNSRPNFSQIVRKLSSFLSSLSDPENMPPPVLIASKNSILPPESPGTSSLMAKRGEQGEDANGKSGNKSRGFLPCFSHCFQSDAENGLIE